MKKNYQKNNLIIKSLLLIVVLISGYSFAIRPYYSCGMPVVVKALVNTKYTHIASNAFKKTSLTTPSLASIARVEVDIGNCALWAQPSGQLTYEPDS